MVLLLESMRSALKAIRANRLRSFLTALGIIIGVASVIAVISLIQGLSRSVTDKFSSLGGSTLTIQAMNTHEDWLRGKLNYLNFEDVEHLRAHIPELRDISPRFQVPGNEVRFGTKSAVAQTMAVTATYQQVQQHFVDRGRFLVPSDDAGARRVAVIGSALIEKLRLPADPVGQYVQVGREWLKIVGVMETKGETFGMPMDEFLVMPFSTGRSMVGAGRKVDLQISVSVDNVEEVNAVKSRIRSVLRAVHRLKPEQKDDFRIHASDQILKDLEEITLMVSLVMGGIVGIALLVGGIGIMNIMLVSVTERTREIGICKAIGARSRDIMMQFLTEAVVLSLLGGLIGLGLGYGLGNGIAALIPNFPPAVVPWWAVLLALGFSGGVGVVFGVIPARKAAKLNPIDALRYE